MSDWIEEKLSVITSKIGSGATPTGGGNAYKSEGISLIRSQNVLDFSFTDDGLAYIDQNQADELRNVEVVENDILINITGESVTRCCIVPKRYLPARVNQHVSIVRPIPENADFRFVYYYFHAIKPELHSMAEIGCTRRALTKGMLENLDILLPPLPEQKAIASVLSSLDDKIDLLHRQNKTLESMAETLFRQWFVEEADEGWEEGKVSDYCVHHKDGVKPQNQPNEMFSHYSIPAFDNSLNPTIECGSEIQSNKYSVVQNSFLFSKLNPNKVKRIWLILDNLKGNAVCSTEFQVVRPKDKKYLFFTYLWLSLPQNYDEIASGVGGTSGSHQRIDPADIFNFPCPLIGNDLLKSLNSKVASIFLKVMENRVQIRTLESLRDTLLPKLMSGEVRVKV